MIKRTVADARNAARDRHTGEADAVGKRPVTDGYNADRDRHADEVGVVPKSILPDIRYSISIQLTRDTQI